MQLSYYVYGDFQSVVNAFHMVAMLFSNHTYQSWFTVVILLTVAAFAFQATAERIFGAKVSDAIWIKRVMIGTVLYSMFMVPTVTLHIHDPVKNKYEAVGGIPAGVGLVAGATSMFTREISELIETAGNPILEIDDIGFGHGYEMLSAVSSLGAIGISQDQYLANTIADYFDKCVIQMQASGDLDLQAMWYGNGKDLLENIRTNYRIFNSTIWTASNPGGYMVYCADAYNHIATELKKPERKNEAFAVFCGRMNYNPTDTQEFLQCRQKFSGVYAAFGANESLGYNETNLFASAVVARMYLMDGVNSGVERAKEIARSMANASDAVSGAMAADFMPMIQGMVATILISLFVIVALLMYVAPMDAFKFYFGLWIWFLTWVLVDVVINIQVQHYAYNVFREIRETGLSLTTMFTIGDSSAQVLGWYGKARWLSMTIASMMTYGIFKFGGGAAFASFAGALGASYSGQAASQGAQIGAPGGEAAQYKKTADDLAGVSAVTIGAGVNSRQYLQAASNTRMSDIGSQVSYGESIGAQADKNFGGSAMGVGGMIGSGEAYNRIKGGHAAAELMERGYSAERQAGSEAFNTAGQIGTAEKTKAVEQAEGMDYAQTLAEGGVGRNLSFAAGAEFRKDEAERLDKSLYSIYEDEARTRTHVTENGVESYAVDSNGNVVNHDVRSGETGSYSFFGKTVTTEDGKSLTLDGEATQRGGQLTVSGTDSDGNAYTIMGQGSFSDDGANFTATSKFMQSKEESARGTMRSGFIDVDGDGVGKRYSDINYDTSTGMVTARGTDGKNYTFKGNITDSDSSDGIIAVSPGSEVSWTAQYQDVQVRTTDGKDINLVGTVEASGTGMPSDDSLIRLKGQTSDGFMANIEGKGNVLPAAFGSGHVLNGQASVSRLERTDTKDELTRESEVDEQIKRNENIVENKVVETYTDDTQVNGLAAIINPNPAMFSRVVNAESKENIAEASLQLGQAIAKNIPESVKLSMSSTERFQNTLSGGVSGQGSANIGVKQGEQGASASGGVNAGMSVQRIKESTEGTSQDKDALTYLYAETIYNARMDANKLVEDGKIGKNDMDDYIASRVTDRTKELVGDATGIKNERYIPDFASGDNPLMRENNDINDTALARAFEASKSGFKTEK